jgi:hypothetical protein
MTLIQQVRDDYLQRLELTWPLDSTARRRLFLVCAVPAFVIAAQLAEVALAYVISPAELFYGDEFPGAAGELWQRLYRFASLVVAGVMPVAVGLLFLGGILAWTRVQASWMFIAGVALASMAFVLGLMVSITYTLTEDEDLISDIGADQWGSVARTFGFLSIGFFFVAFRALAADSGKEALTGESGPYTPPAELEE